MVRIGLDWSAGRHARVYVGTCTLTLNVCGSNFGEIRGLGSWDSPANERRGNERIFCGGSEEMRSWTFLNVNNISNCFRPMNTWEGILLQHINIDCVSLFFMSPSCSSVSTLGGVGWLLLFTLNLLLYISRSLDCYPNALSDPPMSNPTLIIRTMQPPITK